MSPQGLERPDLTRKMMFNGCFKELVICQRLDSSQWKPKKNLLQEGEVCV